MKIILRTVLLLGMVLLVMSGLVQAQEPAKTFCGNLSEADCALVTESEAVMQALDSHSFKMDLTINISGVPNMPVDKLNLHMTGSGAMTVDQKALPDMSKMDPTMMMKDQTAVFNMIADVIPLVSADMEFTLDVPTDLMETLGAGKLPETIKLGLRLVDGVAYLHTADLAMFMPEGKSPAEWMGISLPDLITALLKQPEFNVGMGSMGSSMDMSSNMVKMFSDPETLATFVKLERLADTEWNSHKVAVFRTTLDYPAMFAMQGMQGMQDMIVQQTKAAGAELSEKDIKEMLDMLQGMAKGMQFSTTQNIDLESKYVHQTDMSMVMDMSSMKEQMGTVMIFGFDASITQGDFNSVPAISAPKDAMVIPMESIMPSK